MPSRKKDAKPKTAKKAEKRRTLDIPSLNDEQLREFVLAVTGGRIFTSAHIRQEQMTQLLPLVFMPLALGALEGITEEEAKKIGVFYEYYEKASPRSINGYPMFASVRALNQTDWERAFKAIRAEEERRKNIEV